MNEKVNKRLQISKATKLIRMVENDEKVLTEVLNKFDMEWKRSYGLNNPTRWIKNNKEYLKAIRNKNEDNILGFNSFMQETIVEVKSYNEEQLLELLRNPKNEVDMIIETLDRFVKETKINNKKVKKNVEKQKKRKKNVEKIKDIAWWWIPIILAILISFLLSQPDKSEQDAKNMLSFYKTKNIEKLSEKIFFNKKLTKQDSILMLEVIKETKHLVLENKPDATKFLLSQKYKSDNPLLKYLPQILNRNLDDSLRTKIQKQMKKYRKDNMAVLKSNNPPASDNKTKKKRKKSFITDWNSFWWWTSNSMNPLNNQPWTWTWNGWANNPLNNQQPRIHETRKKKGYKSVNYTESWK